MTIGSAMKASASGMAAERFRMDVISVNIANANTTRVGNEAPYRSRDVVLKSTDQGVQIAEVRQSQSPFPIRNIPGMGNVETSNVEPISEMVNMLSASRAYEANIAAFNTAKGMVKNALNIGRV